MPWVQHGASSVGVGWCPFTYNSHFCALLLNLVLTALFLKKNFIIIQVECYQLSKMKEQAKTNLFSADRSGDNLSSSKDLADLNIADFF